MVRPFDLRDLGLVRRFSEQGVALHAVSSLADNLHPLRDALMSMLVGGEFPTFVSKGGNGEPAGFAQLRIHNSDSQAYVLTVSPAIESELNLDGQDGAATAEMGLWLALLDEAVAAAGQRGIHNIVAEIDEHRPELVLLRRSGFAVYTRQDIWKVRREDYTPLEMREKSLIRVETTDEWDVQLLYANTVPRLVQLVEPSPPLAEGENWVLRDDGELSAYIHIHQGSVASWLRFFVHPNAESGADDIVAAGLSEAFRSDPDIVYCCIRRYESWLPQALHQSGFELVSRQAVMVRHTVHYQPRPFTDFSAVGDAQRVTASSPMIRQFEKRESTQNGH